ncbi:hypothetical protein WJX73_008536 [Symbiochloris irregularis]|uniref:Uncharacterized protein n=1 Tax=Symbiochloris irregularis TaxID=706552 RepID=A0AAW1PE12_9CHLO
MPTTPGSSPRLHLPGLDKIAADKRGPRTRTSSRTGRAPDTLTTGSVYLAGPVHCYIQDEPAEQRRPNARASISSGRSSAEAAPMLLGETSSRPLRPSLEGFRRGLGSASGSNSIRQSAAGVDIPASALQDQSTADLLEAISKDLAEPAASPVASSPAQSESAEAPIRASSKDLTDSAAPPQRAEQPAQSDQSDLLAAIENLDLAQPPGSSAPSTSSTDLLSEIQRDLGEQPRPQSLHARDSSLLQSRASRLHQTTSRLRLSTSPAQAAFDQETAGPGSEIPSEARLPTRADPPLAALASGLGSSSSFLSSMRLARGAGSNLSKPAFNDNTDDSSQLAQPSRQRRSKSSSDTGGPVVDQAVTARTSRRSSQQSSTLEPASLPHLGMPQRSSRSTDGSSSRRPDAPGVAGLPDKANHSRVPLRLLDLHSFF